MTDLNDQTVTKYEFALYSGKVGQIDRILLLRTADICKGRSHFHDKLSGGVLCNSQYTLSADGKREVLTQEGNCCKWLGQSGLRFAGLVLHYSTDKTGQVPSQPFSYDLKLWRFGTDKYLQLKQLNADFPLSRHDLSVSCADEKFQKLTINAKPDCWLLHPQFPAKEKADIEAWAAANVAKLPNELARKFESDAALLQHLQQVGIIVGQPGGGFTGAGAGPAMVPQDQPVANFGDIIGQVTARS